MEEIRKWRRDRRSRVCSQGFPLFLSLSPFLSLSLPLPLSPSFSLSLSLSLSLPLSLYFLQIYLLTIPFSIFLSFHLRFIKFKHFLNQHIFGRYPHKYSCVSCLFTQRLLSNMCTAPSTRPARSALSSTHYLRSRLKGE
jgi:hypothetical protein